MSTYFMPIETALILFPILSFFLIIPWLIYSYRKFGFLSLWESLVVYSFAFYLLTALFLVLLPLPDTRNTCAYQSPDTVHYSLTPFYFIGDIIKNSSVVWSQPTTYVRLLSQSVFLQAAFNFLLLLPLGVYLRYFLQERRYWKKAFGFGLGLSLFYEITQITGIYGIYNCAYRIFDVDDLILNSTGTLVGFLIAPVILALFPSRKNLLAKSEELKGISTVPPLSQLLATLIDYLLIKISWNVTFGLFTTNNFAEIIYTTILFIILFAIVPYFWNGKTIGTNILRFRLTQTDGANPSWQGVLKRAFALYLPLAITWLISAISSAELDINSSFYAFRVWVDVAAIALELLMWTVLFFHAVFILLKKGKRTFYFDYVADLVSRKK